MTPSALPAVSSFVLRQRRLSAWQPGAKQGSSQPNRDKVAEITWDQVKAIAEDKMPDLNCFTVESAMRMVAGTARSMGITVKGAFPANA